ncbi:hypothetical protein GCM10010129_59200 [Streptomyces fumigatiscleroticus]|nr:hypothetical protein GCM10010129_59200 [Streptomyces fumigatiscleroticus]
MGRARVRTERLVAGRYRLLDVLDRETGRVCWHGEDVEAARACLVIRTGLSEVDPAGPGARRITGRVLRTSETMGLLRPGRVAPVLDAVVEDDALWTVTDWIDGVPLGELVARQGAVHPARAARIGLELLRVLDAAHGEGITHGELSPGQVFVGEEDRIVVTGYGLAGATLAPRLTAPSYASPEQSRDERVGPAADLWALGAILYTMVEGRPPFRDRGRPEVTLEAVDRLPVRAPVRAGPLTRTVQGLLRKDSRERPTRPVVRQALISALEEVPAAAPRTVPALRTGLALALALAAVTVAVLALTQRLPGTATSAAGPPRPSAAAPSGDGTGRPTATPSPAPPATALPPGYLRHTAPEGFSLALPEGWRRLRTTRVSGPAYRVVFGAAGDPRTLAVTYSARVGPDPVAVWRDDVEPGLRRSGGYRRLGHIRATTYRGRRAADMQWLAAGDDGRPVRTFGRGFLLGGGRGFSLRWTAPAGDWDDAANEQALATLLRTFRTPSD